MNQKYKLKNEIDLTFDEVLSGDEPPINQASTDLRPTPAMQARFIQNCVDLDILELV